MFSAHPGNRKSGPGIRQVEKRRHVKPLIAVGEMQFRNGPQGMAFDIFVGQHDPFGLTGGTAGIIEVGHIIIRYIGGRGRLIGVVFQQRFVFHIFPVQHRCMGSCPNDFFQG